jgi:hypothetical protein
MLTDQLNNLPVLKSFRSLKWGDPVYSRQYGVGKVSRLYGDEDVIVEFQQGIRRLTLKEDEISLIPAQLRTNNATRIKMSVNGKEMSFRAFKKMREEERKREKLLKQLQALKKLKK